MYSVLYVDDEPGLLEIGKLFLEQSGEFTVTTGTSAGQALASPDLASFDAIVSDYQMPEMDGIQFLKSVRAQNPDIPFILFTGRGREEVVIEAINNGADFYIQKGGEPKAQFAELMHKVKSAVERRRAALALQSQTIFTRAIFDSVPGILYLYDSSGHLVQWNRNHEIITGYTGAELPGRYVMDWFPDEADRVAVREAIERAKGWGKASVEASLVTRSGERIPFLFTVRRLEIGSQTYFTGIGIDITERREAEAALAASEEKFRGISERSSDLIYVEDGRGVITYVSPSVERILGYVPEEVIGKPGDFFIPDEDPERIRRGRAIKQQGGSVENFELAVRRKDGSVAVLDLQAIPVIEKGIFLGLQSIGRDITGRKMAEQALAASEAKFRGMADRSADAILIVDEKMTVTYASPSTLQVLGYEPGELVGKSRDFAASIIFSPSRAEFDAPVPAAMRGLLVEKSDMQITKKNGDTAWVDIHAVPVMQNGAFMGAQITIRDITGRKMAEEALRESEAKFATVFRDSPASLSLVDARSGTFLDVNNAFVHNTGYDREEVIGKTADEMGFMVRPGITTEIAANIRSEKRINGMEIEFRAKNGDVHTCLYSSSLLSMQGKPVILSSVENISRLKETELAHQAMVKSMIGTTGLDALKTITGAVSSWLGTECVMIGEIQPDHRTVKVHAMLLDGREITDFSYMLKDTPCENAAEKGFCLYPDRVQEIFPRAKDLADLHIRGYVGTSLRDSTGAVIGIFCAMARRPLRQVPFMREFLDIIAVKAAAEIERARIGQALEENRRQLAEAMEMAHLVYWETNPDGTFLFNDRFYTLYGTTAAREGGYRMDPGTYIREFIPPEDWHRLLAMMNPGRSDPYDTYIEHRIIRRDGAVRYISARIIRMFDETGVLRAHGANQDITDRRNAEDAIRRANRQLNLLTGITRHDILNKVTVILGLLTLAAKKEHDTAITGYLERIETATAAIRSQVEFTRVYEDLGTHDPQWISLDSVMPRGHLPATIALDADVQGISLFSDAMLERVFFNLLDNSIRYGERVTTITVSAARRGTDLVVTWEDNGVGIPVDEKEQIFQRGFGKNTGLGLFLVREILALTRITIAETGEPGRGARFEMVVPEGGFRCAENGPGA